MTPDQIKQLQAQLNAQGANLKVDGILGPLTTAAMNKYSSSQVQQAPSSANGMTADQIRQLQTQLNAEGANLKVDGMLGPQTTAAMNAAVSKQLVSNPSVAPLLQNNDADAIVEAYTTGNWSGVRGSTGQPFTPEEQQAALSTAQSALAPGFNETQAKDTSDAISALQGQEDTNQNFLNTQKTQFQADKSNLDQSAANSGVLFSGSRFQANNNLKTKYEQAADQEERQVGSNIAKTGSDYAYKYGTPAAATLSSYFNLGDNKYDANVATGGATSAPKLSSYFNPSSTSYQGTAVNQNNANAQVRAASLLANKANKIVPLGYKTQF